MCRAEGEHALVDRRAQGRTESKGGTQKKMARRCSAGPV
jgi:hypothetical protein